MLNPTAAHRYIRYLATLAQDQRLEAGQRRSLMDAANLFKRALQDRESLERLLLAAEALERARTDAAYSRQEGGVRSLAERLKGRIASARAALNAPTPQMHADDL